MLALLCGLLCGLVALALETSPRVAGTVVANAESAAHLRQWLRLHDPQRARDGRLYVVQATAGDLQLLLSQAARLAGGAAQAQLADGQLRVQASLPLRRFWLNADLQLGDGATRPVIQRLQIGSLHLPGWLAEPLLDLALRVWDPARNGAPPVHEMLQGTRWQAARALIVYRWHADLPQRVAGWVVPAPQLARLRVYHDALIVAMRAKRGPHDLPDLLTPLFTLAVQRSADGGEAAAENRAALLVLAAHVSDRPLASLLPAARDWPRVPRRGVSLAGRPDFPLHYLVSAALAAEGSGPLADAMGLAKEASDARDGSGFSFNDIAVNRAGTRLGERAVQAPRRVQAALAAGATAQTLLPDVSDLPEFLPEREFVARYGGIGAPAYQQLLADIEARVAALPLYR
jgi:hypothetical protein